MAFVDGNSAVSARMARGRSVTPRAARRVLPWMRRGTCVLSFKARLHPLCPHRPEAQDVALSRPKHGFESRWGRTTFRINRVQQSAVVHQFLQVLREQFAL